MKAICKYAKMSAQKLRLVANLIRFKSIFIALRILTFTQKKASLLILKVLQSAIANAKYLKKDINKMKVIQIYINEGTNTKRMVARAKGRVNYIIKRTSHIYIHLGM